jgi:VWFA-related protein
VPGRLVLVAFLAAAAASPALAQPTFRSGVDLVRFDVRVVDEAGRPITDLRPEELEILENGRPLPLVLFQRITEPAESYVDAALRAVTAEVSSNDAFPRGHLYILIFDQQHIAPGNEQRARRAAEQFIRRRVRPTDRVALFALPGPGPQLAFTADKLRAIQALESVRGSYERNLSTPLGAMTAYEAHRVIQGDEQLAANLMARMSIEGSADVGTGAAGGAAAIGADDPAVARRLLQENARAIVNQTDSMSRQFLQRLADVITGFREIEGRKTVVLFSEGFFQENLSRELEAVAAAAAQSYCVFYSFDLNQRGIRVTDAYASDSPLATEIQARVAPMATLAVETDGSLVVDAGGRSSTALDALADQAQDYYLVGFTPSDEARLNRGKYRRVTVRVKRPSARVSARTGYALGPETATVDKRRAINAVLAAPFVQQGLKVDYTTYVMKAPESGRHRVVLSLAADLPVRSATHDLADVVFVVRDTRDGRVVASGTDAIALPASARPGATLGSGTWRVQFGVPPGSYLMRTVVREPGGLVGSADRRLEVRPLDSPDVTVSDLVIGSAVAGLPVRPRAYTGEGLSGVVEAYGRTPVQLEGLVVKIELRRPSDGSRIASLAADLHDAQRDEAGVSRRASFQLPLVAVPPGDYLAHAIVMARGEIVAERTRQVEVLGGQAPAAADTAGARTVPELVSPVEVIRGDLARNFVAWLQSRTQGTPAAEAARRAAEGQWEEVELALRGVDSSNAAARALDGLARFAREDYAGAVTALQAALDGEPRSALTAFFLGWAHEGAGDARAAIGAWRNAAYLDPSLVSAHLAVADGYLRLSQPALAVQALKAGLTALPSSPELLARLGQIERGGR